MDDNHFFLYNGIIRFNSSFPDREINPLRKKSGEFFGLFNTFGKAGAFMGPALVGLFLALFENVRVSLLPILVLFVLGLIVLYFVKTDETF